jgi:hypothetical protein
MAARFNAFMSSARCVGLDKSGRGGETMRITQRFAAACALAAGLAVPAAAEAQRSTATHAHGPAATKTSEPAATQGHEHAGAQAPAPAGAKGHAMCPEGAAQSVLSVGDFNGDTIVDGADLKELADRVARRENVAFFDMNGDYAVDTKDLLLVARQVGARSTPLDQELAAVFRTTERYRDIGNAIEDGFIPATESGRGHGVHWTRNEDPDARFELTRPEGLNYSEDGKLLAIFYAVTPGEPDMTPEGFTGEEPWHYHVDACLGGIDRENPSYDWRTLDFEECVPRQECKSDVWLAKFYMVHAWLFEQNPCGVFGLENPRITSGADPASSATRCPEGGGHTGHRPAPPAGAAAGHEHVAPPAGPGAAPAPGAAPKVPSRPAGVCPPRSDAAAPGAGQHGGTEKKGR